MYISLSQNMISLDVTLAMSFSLCAGVSLIRTDYAVLQTLSSPLAGRVMARQLFPWAIGLPLLLHWLIFVGEQQNWYDRTTGTAYQTLGATLMLSGLIGWTAQLLDRVDRKRQQAAEDYLRQIKINLEQRTERRIEHRIADRLQSELQARRQIGQMQIGQTQIGQMLCESDAQFQRLIQDLNVGVLLQDADAKILLSNPKATELMGLTADQLLGEGSLALGGRVIREDGSLFPFNAQPVALAIANRKPVRNVVVGIYRQIEDLSLEAQPVWLLVDAEPQLTPSGEIRHVLCTFSDITKRKRLLELKTAQVQKEKALNQVMQTIRHSLDLDTVFTTATAAIAQMLQADRAAIAQYLPAHALWRNVADHHLPSRPSVLGKTVSDAAHFASDQLKQFQVVQFDGASPIASEASLALVSELTEASSAAWLVVPLQVNGLLWGSLDLTRNSDRLDWQESEVDLALAIVDQLAIAIQQSELYQKLQAANQKLQRLATLDGLTQIPNRRRFDDYLHQESLRMAREQAPLSLILCDVDFFKPYNDTYGHLAGDACLIQVAQAISRAVKRPGDLATRYGGEEFAIVLPNTDSKGAMQVAQAIRAEIQQTRLPHAASSVSQQVTVSLGIASLLEGCPYSVTALIDTADQALYQAKKEGRDRVQVKKIGKAADQSKVRKEMALEIALEMALEAVRS